MAGKAWSKPTGMVFKKFYCHKCGNQLKTEKTHRVVKSNDRDFSHYDNFEYCSSSYYDVYNYRFKCPSCESRITYDDQRVIEMIQKKCMRKKLSDIEINRNRKECEKRAEKSVLLGKIISSLIFAIIAFSVYFFLVSERTKKDLLMVAVFVAIFTTYTIISNAKRHKGCSMSDSYSYEEKIKLERLHTYSSHNKELLEKSNKCYCFYCLQTFESSEIKSFLDNEQTAMCPSCMIDSIIPDSIDETIDENTLSMMHEYWF